ncbi:hypothetical protein ACHAXS_001172 [Conticribra weissflogii]
MTKLPAIAVSAAAILVTAVAGFAPPAHLSARPLPQRLLPSVHIDRNDNHSKNHNIHSHSHPSTLARRPRRTSLFESSKPNKSGLDGNVTNKLLTETIAPFRGLRLFLYAAFASGAFVGGLITASGVAAAMNGLRSDVDLNTEYLNLAIDFGAVAIFAVLAKIDLDKGAELNASVEEKVKRKKEMKKLTKAMREREKMFRELSLDVRVTEQGDTRTATVATMQSMAKQHVILVAGPGRAIRDALRGAQLNKVNFAMTNILVVPYETGLTEADRASKPSGFGDRPTYETQPYVAEPVGPGWEEFIEAEIQAAVKQAGEQVRDDGIALVVANDGKVLRRGVGRVPWKQMVDELEEAVTGEKKETTVPFLEFLE